MPDRPLKNRKILIAGPFDPGALAGSYERAFEAAGYEPFRFESESAYREAGKVGGNPLLRRLLRRFFWRRLNRDFEEAAIAIKPALILAVKCCFLEGETVRRVRRKLGIPVSNIYPDHPYCGAPLYSRTGASTQRMNLIEVLREYTSVFMWEEQGLCKRLRADGVRAIYLPFGADPEFLNRRTTVAGTCPECSRPHDVVFVGHYSPKRRKHISAVATNSVALWGNGWNRAVRTALRRHRLHRAGTCGATMAGLYTRAAVSLNILGDLNVPGHNMRTFEIPASGGVMLAHYTAEQDKFFPENEAALYYRAPEELDDRIESLLKDPPFRERIRRNAARIALQHTYRHRAQEIIRGLNAEA